jgi:hypothetical protein
MELPRIGQRVTTADARALCRHFGYEFLVARIERTPEAFKDWTFDGASMVPDRLVSALAGIPNLTRIALQHDLKYAYGEPGNKQERQKADEEFRRDLMADGASEPVAEIMFQAVRLFGDPPIRTSFSWGFARK